MSPSLGMYYRLRAEMRKRKTLSNADASYEKSRPRRTAEAGMFIRLIAVTGGLLLAVSLIMQSLQ